MSGIEHLQDFSQRPRPLTGDPVVARAWGLEHFAHYSAVSRTLHACDTQTVAAVEAAIVSFSQPFIGQAVRELVRRGLPITYDFDLTGQAVSSTSTTYPEAAFGSLRVNDQVRLGYPHLTVGQVSIGAGMFVSTGKRADLAGRFSSSRRHGFGRVSERVGSGC